MRRYLTEVGCKAPPHLARLSISSGAVTCLLSHSGSKMGQFHRSKLLNKLTSTARMPARRRSRSTLRKKLFASRSGNAQTPPSEVQKATAGGSTGVSASTLWAGNGSITLIGQCPMVLQGGNGPQQADLEHKTFVEPSLPGL